MSKNTPWRAEDDAYLRAHYPTQPTAAVAAHLQRSARHVQQRAYDLGVKKAPGAKTLRTGRWTHLDDLLQLLYADMLNEDLSELLGMSMRDIATRASRLGLHKSPAVLALTYRASMLRQGQRQGQFTAGFKPWNKGKHGYSVEQGKSHFQAGNRPPTWVPVGTERWTTPPRALPHAARYLKRKVAEPNRWQLVHRIVWEQHHGPIPEGHAVIFHDGDTSNIDISNLRCISRTELSRSNGAAVPIDLLPVWELTRQLDQEIKEIEKAEHDHHHNRHPAHAA
ncbi:HNH endonuclease [Delftia acidovorans]|uniref:HNH endonuclease signature motif containing protein n=1 Tax=Delftia acidovorans TaxID=80866 RepID=UPI0018D66DCB|nr:HNH endonuclease signature motif containing protein [Delftia acidovorans]QPR34493.1 HNH endonuclease [Delftia acidovorans]